MGHYDEQRYHSEHGVWPDWGRRASGSGPGSLATNSSPPPGQPSSPEEMSLKSVVLSAASREHPVVQVSLLRRAVERETGQPPDTITLSCATLAALLMDDRLRQYRDSLRGPLEQDLTVDDLLDMFEVKAMVVTR